VAEEFGWSPEQVERWARTQRSATDDPAPEPPSPDEGLRSRSGTPVRTAAIAALLALLVLVFLQPGLLLDTRAGAVELYADTVTGWRPGGGGAQLVIGEADAAYLNRIFEEQDTEVGYCGLIDADRQLRSWLATLGDRADTSVQLSVRNCPTGADPLLALMHTHPNGDPRLTPADRQALEVADVDFLCIQHGRIEASPGQPTERLRCYSRSTQDGVSGPSRVQVVIGG
jgi:hypothetical protein